MTLCPVQRHHHHRPRPLPSPARFSLDLPHGPLTLIPTPACQDPSSALHHHQHSRPYRHHSMAGLHLPSSPFIYLQIKQQLRHHPTGSSSRKPPHSSPRPRRQSRHLDNAQYRYQELDRQTPTGFPGEMQTASRSWSDETAWPKCMYRAKLVESERSVQELSERIRYE